jgi:hypothetical protein
LGSARARSRIVEARPFADECGEREQRRHERGVLPPEAGRHDAAAHVARRRQERKNEEGWFTARL